MDLELKYFTETDLVTGYFCFYSLLNSCTQVTRQSTSVILADEAFFHALRCLKEKLA